MDKVVWTGIRARLTRMTTYLLYVCMVIAIDFALAQATTQEVPVKVRAVEVDGSAWTIEVVAGRAGTLDGVRIEGVTSASPLPASDSAPPDAAVSQRFRVTISDVASATHCIVRYRFDGQPYEERISLSRPLPGRVQPVTRAVPPSPRQARPDDKIGPASLAAGSPDFSIYAGASDEIEVTKQNLKLKKDPWDIHVSGRLVYERPERAGHPAATIGVCRGTVRVVDNNWYGDTTIGETTTDWDGYFDFKVHWKPKLLDADPDIYVEFLSSNSRVRVNRPVFETTYRHQTSTDYDFTGTELNVGTVEPTSDAQAFHILTNITRAWRWSDERGFTASFVEVKWPSNVDSYYNPVFETIHIDPEEEWTEITQVHEWGHHWTHSLGEWQTPTFGSDFAHNMWCEENEVAAYIEGWADWISDAIVRTFETTYGIESTSFDNAESISTCGGTVNDWRTTEGFLAAVLRDIMDGGTIAGVNQNEDDPKFPGDDCEDVLSMGEGVILEVAHLDGPLSTHDYLEAFVDRNPGVMCALWETARNCGIEMDDIAPEAVTGLTAGFPGGPTACGGYTAALRFTWQPAVDAWSCAGGYSVLVAASAQMPDATVDVSAPEYTTPCLAAPASYVFNVRAVDRAGNWSGAYASFPFAFDGPPIGPDAYSSADESRHIERGSALPPITAFTVKQNQPNPFTGVSELKIGLIEDSNVTIDVFDVSGRRVKHVETGILGAGWQSVVLNDRDSRGAALPNGIYFCQVRANGSAAVRKIVISR